MLRTTLIHILILLAPTILYVAWLLLARRAQLSRARWAATFRAMPWLRLLGGGLVLVAASLVALALYSISSEVMNISECLTHPKCE